MCVDFTAPGLSGAGGSRGSFSQRTRELASEAQRGLAQPPKCGVSIFIFSGHWLNKKQPSFGWGQPRKVKINRICASVRKYCQALLGRPSAWCPRCPGPAMRPGTGGPSGEPGWRVTTAPRWENHCPSLSGSQAQPGPSSPASGWASQRP